MNNRVLLVDDEDDILISLKRNLVKHFQIETANSGIEAIRLLNTSPQFACIVSDFNMPKMNGIEFFAEAKKIIPNTLRIMLTGHADLNVAMEAINQDFIYKFLVKPTFPDILIKHLKDAVEYYRLQTMEKEMIDMKVNFISIVANEFKTPVNSLLTAAYLLPEFFKINDQKKVDNFMSKMQITLEGMNKLLEKILTIGKLDANINLKFFDLDIVSIINELIKEFKSADSIGHDFLFDHLQTQLYISTDLVVIKLIISNLISNAIKYSPKNSIIKVKLTNEIDQIILSVEDCGIGIPENQIVHLFDAFYRCQNVGFQKGTGLGLTIVNKGVELLKGQIKVNSIIGKGSTFTVILNKDQRIYKFNQ